MFLSSHELMHPFGMLRPTSVGHRWKPNVEIAPNCPRCDSANTKFCYYNNYSLTQPRYFCKACRRYWTKGGSLRNVPVGGGCRKNHRRHGKSTRTIITTATSENNYTPSTLRPDLALDHMVGRSSHHSSMLSPLLPDHDDQSSSSRDASGTIDLAALYSKFLNHCPETTLQQELHGHGHGHGQFVQELAGRAGDSYELTGSEGAMGELSYDPFDVAGGQYESSLGIMTASISAGEAFPAPGLSSWQAPELQPGLCPFPGMGCDWSSLDQSSFGAF